MNSGVPISVPWKVIAPPCSSGLASDLAMPKSMIFGCGRPSGSATSTLLELRSRCSTAFWWACCIASSTSRNSSSRARSGRSRWRQNFASVGPSTSSMTKNGRPFAVVPASSRRAMPGWSMRFRASRSAAKRASTSRESMPGLSTLTATGRRIGSCCSAR